MKRKNLIPALFISLFLVTFSFAQNSPFSERAPEKNQKTVKKKKEAPNSAFTNKFADMAPITKSSDAVPTDGVMDKDPNAKNVPIPSDELFDLIFLYPCAVGGGEAGIETDGNFIYTTKWNGNHLYKYSIDGTFIDTIVIPGVAEIRDMAFDGTYFYGGHASTTVYQLDLDNETLVSSFIAPTNVRAIAYNEDEDVFYANNWSDNITTFDMAGTNLGSWSVGAFASYYGFAYDNITGTQYLWGYSQSGATQNELIQMELPAGSVTGLTFDMGSLLTIDEGLAGGLCASPVCYDYALIGMSQNEFIWAIEISTAGCCADDDLGINSILEPSSGVGYTSNEAVTVQIENFGYNSQSDFVVSFTYNGNQPYFDTVFTTLNFEETYEHTFDTTIDMSFGGTHIIESCSYLPDDECIINDCKIKILEGDLLGSLEGYVTEYSNGEPIEGALIEVDNGIYSAVTTSDGYYSIAEINIGDWQVICSKEGYNIDSAIVIITEGNTAIQDFLLTAPVMSVSPSSIDVLLEPYMTAQDTIIIGNTGSGSMNWSAEIEYLSDDTKELFDLIWEMPVGVGSGEAGLETNGNYIYTTKWNGAGEYYRYGMDGVYIEEIIVTGAAGTRDMAFDGTYFYGGPASTTVYQLDLDNAALVSSFSAPTDVRAIAYSEDEDVFYANNWGSFIIKFDMSGTNLGSFACGPIGDSYYGFAYDNYSSPGTPYLWGSAQVGYSQNELIQMELPSGIETGLTFDAGSLLSAFDITGGLAIDNNIQEGTWAFLGTCQNVNLWAIELTQELGGPWLTIDTASGILNPGMFDQILVNFNPSEIQPGVVKTANINISSNPITTPTTVPVSMSVGIPSLGFIEGQVSLNGVIPYNFGNVMNVDIIANGSAAFNGSPNSSGYYTMYVYNGIYNVSASLYGYESQTIIDTVFPDSTIFIDFDLQTNSGRLLGTVIDLESGNPIEGATITVFGPDINSTTGSNGYYEIFLEGGIYDVQIDHPTYSLAVVEDIEINTEQDTQQDFELEYNCDYCDATTSNEDEWIMDVICGDINNLGTSWQGGVADYTDLSTIIIPGLAVDITVENGNAWASDIVYVWVDWNMDCEFEQGGNEEFQLENVGGAGQTFTGQILAPANAPPGMHTMRVRMTYSTPPEPCGEASYGEVEDYSLIIPGVGYGSIEGYLTNCITGNPIENGIIDIGGFYILTTGADGYFYWDTVLSGEWELNYSAAGYCPPLEQIMVTIIAGQTTTLDELCLYPLGFEVEPLTINVELEPGEQTTEILTLSNTGYCDIEWNATVIYNNNGSDELFDLIWEMPVGVGGGEAGIETNGNYIYTTKWNGTGEYYRYAMDGAYIEEIMVAGAAGTRDMAWDGTYFYGGAASTTIFEMDLDNATLISSFTAPANSRAIAYNHDENVFYCNNWSDNITIFDKAGTNLGNFPIGASAASYYGLAYESTIGIPFLWGYSQTGNTQNELIQIELPSGVETGLTFDIGSSLSAYDIAGGLAIDDHIASGLWTFLGTCQNVNIWTAELNSSLPAWLTLATSGLLSGGEINELELQIDATSLIPGNYEAEVHFAIEPYIDVPIVDVSLEVIGFVPPINLTGYYNCTHIYLSWEMSAGNNPTSFNIYRDGAFIGSVIDPVYYEAYVMPEVEFCYQVTAVYEVGESMPTPEFCITIPTPDDLEPFDLEGIPHYPDEFEVTLLWEEPIACLFPDGYNIYRDGVQINGSLVTELTYIDVGLEEGLYEYWVTAVYYFGESVSSNTTYVLFYGTDEIALEQYKIFPNPCDDILHIQSDFKIDELSIYNIHGQFIKHIVVKQSEIQIDVSQFEPGVYFIELEVEDKTVLRKIVVE